MVREKKRGPFVMYIYIYIYIHFFPEKGEKIVLTCNTSRNYSWLLCCYNVIVRHIFVSNLSLRTITIFFCFRFYFNTATWKTINHPFAKLGFQLFSCVFSSSSSSFNVTVGELTRCSNFRKR